MKISKSEILKNHCYTELVFERINKKLNASFSKEESKALIKKVLEATNFKHYKQKGKNFYISNKKHNIIITINSNTFRVITVNNITK